MKRRRKRRSRSVLTLLLSAVLMIGLLTTVSFAEGEADDAVAVEEDSSDEEAYTEEEDSSDEEAYTEDEDSSDEEAYAEEEDDSDDEVYAEDEDSSDEDVYSDDEEAYSEDADDSDDEEYSDDEESYDEEEDSDEEEDFDDVSYDPADAVSMTLGETYNVDITEEGGYEIFSFTPTETGTYKFYTSGSYDTYSYLYDADLNLLASDDDGGSGVNTAITYELDAGSTYYIVFEMLSFYQTGSFTAAVEEYVSAVSAALNKVSEGNYELIEDIDSYTTCDWEYDEDAGEYIESEEYEYYSFWYIDFEDGDQIVITLADGSQIVYTYYSAVYDEDEDDYAYYYDFVDENGDDLDYSISYDQSYENQWTVGNTYYFTLTLSEYGNITVDIPVTIVENLYADAEVTVALSSYTLIEGIDSYTDYDENDEAYEYYYFWGLDFSDGDTIVITTADGESITYTFVSYLYDEDSNGYTYYYEFVDEDGEILYWTYTDDQETNHWSVGNTEPYYFTLYLEDYGISVDVPVYIIENPYEDAAVEIDPDTFTLTEGVDSSTATDDDGEEFEYYGYYYIMRAITDGTQLTITLEDGTQIVYTYYADEYAFYSTTEGWTDWYLEYDYDQYEEHWEVGETYDEIYIVLEDYGLQVEISVTIADGEDHVHSYLDAAGKNPTCEEDGYIIYLCDCGDTYTVVLPATGHTYESEVTKEATETEDGVITYTCTVCGDTYTEVIPATGMDSGDTDSEDTDAEDTDTGDTDSGDTDSEDTDTGDTDTGDTDSEDTDSGDTDTDDTDTGDDSSGSSSSGSSSSTGSSSSGSSSSGSLGSSSSGSSSSSSSGSSSDTSTSGSSSSSSDTSTSSSSSSTSSSSGSSTSSAADTSDTFPVGLYLALIAAAAAALIAMTAKRRVR